MAEPGDAYVNSLTQERIVFVRTAAQTGGELLEMENVWTRPDHRTAPHVHPRMEETWEVLSGRAGFRIGDEELHAGPGETVVAAPGVPHHGWNEGGGETVLRITMRPALRWEDFVMRMFEAPERTAGLLPEFRDEIAPARSGRPRAP
ncbi:MAG TPA: cupin domain-containing protein [Thermoleophilaceae bacterium]|jgi:mannose-6-phosphate isomerase-like protein (cupin superfamily)